MKAERDDDGTARNAEEQASRASPHEHGADAARASAQGVSAHDARLRILAYRRRYFRHRYAILFYSLLATLGAGPLVAALRLDAKILHIFLILNLLAVALGTGTKRSWEWLRVAVGVVVGLRLLATQVDVPVLAMVALPLWTAIALVGAARALRFALRASWIEREHVYAALSAYLLAGVFFGALYSAIESVWPGSFAESGQSLNGSLTLANAIYFSFVTLATLGYGDFLPRSEVARGIAMLEAVAGQLYLAVLVARIVTLHVGGRRRGEGS